MQATFPILLHAGFCKILRESQPSFRARVQKTLLRLQCGLWGGGTRVKRLTSVRQAVFEARVDSGNRLLFTAIRAADREDPERLTTQLQVWDVVHHDKVTRRARRNLVPEAEFLDFQAIEEFEIIEPPPQPAAEFDEVSPDASDPLLHFLIPSDGFESRAPEGINGGIRWYLAPPSMLADESEFQRVMDHSQGELELKLTRDQYDVLRAPGPLLLAGSAGSGKTTIAIHRLIEARFQMGAGRLLYLSYSPWLVDYARRLYRDVTLARGQSPDVAPPQFFTFSDFYRKVIPSQDSASYADLVTREPFTAWLQRSSSRIDPALVWEELRSILKGACLNLGRSTLEERAYYELGRKRAPLFVNERPEMFGIATRYQQWLSSTGRFDQIDLCRRAFREVRHEPSAKYEVIVCDEVQDLTELEVAFVLSLSANQSLGGIMLAGDTQQIVNPTGFRWAEVRQSIMKISRTAPKLARLRRNCRSVRPLVDLANSILTLKQQLFGRYEEDSLEDAIAEGPAPIQIVDEEERVLEAVRDFGPRCAILVLDDAERESLSRRLDTTRIFHVRDAKGLEFETVILWKLLKSINGLIDRFVRQDPRIERDARFKQFLHYLYVAVTRARRHLAVYEGPDAHPFWENSRFRGRLETEAAGMLARLFRESAAPAEWVKEGDYYNERTRYRQAAECYRRAGLVIEESTALAMHAESMEDWPRALDLWKRIGKIEHQGILLEKLGRLPEAIDLYFKSGQASDAQRLEIVLLEKQGRWAEAAKRWEDAGKPAEAVRCYQRAGNNAQALTLEATNAETQKDWTRAAECWFALKSYEAAARCFRKCQDARNASLSMALRSEGLKDWSKAAAAYRRAGDSAKAEECKAKALETSGYFLKAAKLRERLGQRDQAFQLYKRAGDQDAIDRFTVERADIRQSQLAAVEGLMERGKYHLAIQLAGRRRPILKKRLASMTWSFSEASDQRLHDELGELDDLIIECRALLAEQANAWTKAAGYWRRLGDFDRADKTQQKGIEALDDPVARGYAWLTLNEFEKAIAAFESADYRNGVVRARALLFEREKDWQQAAGLWQSIGDTQQHAAAMANLARSNQNFSEAARWHHLAGQRTLAAEAERAARKQSRTEAVRIGREHATLF